MPHHARPNPRAELFALLVAMGAAGVDAYMKAYDSRNRRSASASASALLAKVSVSERVASLRQEHFKQVSDAGFLTLDETRRGLAQIWRCSLADLIDDKGRLRIDQVRKLPAWCIGKFEVTETSYTRGSKRPTTVTKRHCKLELTDKLRAVQIDAELRGDKPPDLDDTPTAERIARRKRALAFLAKLPGHGGGLLPAIDV